MHILSPEIYAKTMAFILDIENVIVKYFSQFLLPAAQEMYKLDVLQWSLMVFNSGYIWH